MKGFVVFEKCRAVLLLGIVAGFVLGTAQAIDSRQHSLLENDKPGLHLLLFPQPGLLGDEFGFPQDLCPVADDQNGIAAVEEPERKEEDPEPPPPFHGLILQAADRHRVDPALIKAIIMAESSYNPKAISKEGARGLMQLMPRTAKSLGVKDIWDPEHNINGGVKYFRQLLDRFNGNVKLALAAYNAGARYVRQYQGVPPFDETRLYIKKVLKFRKIYEKEMNAEDDLGLSVKL
jgi:soluble lytic murein transglycosylase-like protein